MTTASRPMPADQLRRVMLMLGAPDDDFKAAGLRVPSRRERRRWAYVMRYGERVPPQ